MASGTQQVTAGNLPAELSSFVGRVREVAEVRKLVSAARVITLTGPGGIGKSRLALHAAGKLGRHFPDGVWLVELAELEGSDLLADALARAMQVQERRNDAINEALMAHLRERRLLLVLDNCEHVLDACRQLVASVVSECERVRILCTSRERLDVPGEAVVVLSALDVPANGKRLPIAALAEVEAPRLLVDRAVAVAPHFALTSENRRAVSEICRRLDGLPLAIELAAVRLASMTADDLRDRLDDRLRLLAAAHTTGPGHGQTLRATVDWSYELLSDGERILWRRLSVFAGSFGLEAAEDVCSDARLEREQIVDLVASLVGKSILTMEHGSRRGRYRLLETLKLYGAQRLAEAGEDVELAQRHAAWYAERFSGGERPWWGTPEQGEVFETLDIEWANLKRHSTSSRGRHQRRRSGFGWPRICGLTGWCGAATAPAPGASKRSWRSSRRPARPARWRCRRWGNSVRRPATLTAPCLRSRRRGGSAIRRAGIESWRTSWAG